MCVEEAVNVHFLQNLGFNVFSLVVYVQFPFLRT